MPFGDWNGDGDVSAGEALGTAALLSGIAGSGGPGFEVRGVALVAHAVDADMEGGDAPAAAGATGGLTEQGEQGEGVLAAREAEQDMVALADKAEMAHAF